MKFMMIFMGIMFYKVASGLCLYFIASTSWSLIERKFLPKSAAKKDDESGPPPPRPRPSNDNGSAAAKKKRRSQRGR
jgi:membrane protein insertase Oxa1/YidC/SpoIIIJ